jgi:hypothetical protein
MSDNDFQARLQRIEGNRGTPLAGSLQPEPTGRRPPNLALMVVSVLVIWIGAGLVRFANENYDELKADGGVGLSLGIGIGAIAIVIWGIVLFVRSIRPRPAASIDQTSLTDEMRTTKNRLAMIGIVLGIASAICMYMAGTALRVGTPTAEAFGNHMMLAAALLAVVATLIALVTRISPGFGFFRVVLSYVTGFILVLGIVRVVQFDLRSLPSFMALLE